MKNDENLDFAVAIFKKNDKNIRKKKIEYLKEILHYLYETYGEKNFIEYPKEAISSAIEFIQDKEYPKGIEKRYFEALNEFLAISFEENWQLVEKTFVNMSEVTLNHKTRSTIRIFAYLYQKFGRKPLLEYNYDEIKSLFGWLDSLNITVHMKKMMLRSFKDLIDHALGPLVRNGRIEIVGYWNYLFDKVKFREKGSQLDFFEIEAREIIIFMDKLKRYFPEDYYLFGIIIYSGCRIGGFLDLQIKNIDFEKNLFKTQEKSTRISSGFNTYFLPEFFMKDLKRYLERQENKSKKKVFEGTYDVMRNKLRRYNHNWRFHLLRHAMRANLHKKGCPTEEAELIINHQSLRYLKTLSTIDHLQPYYIKFFPY